MRVMTGGSPVTSFDDTRTPNEGLKYYSGSAKKQQQNKDTSEKVRKSFELLHLLTGGS
jgi:hypothetical protein